MRHVLTVALLLAYFVSAGLGQEYQYESATWPSSASARLALLNSKGAQGLRLAQVIGSIAYFERIPAAPNQPPVIASAAGNPASGVAPLTVQFAVSASDPEGGPLTYVWIFGDPSSTSTASNPLHVYVSAGTFFASVTVTDNQGATKTSPLISITVTAAPSQVTAPSIAPNGGTFTSAQSVVLASATIGASIRYSIDGSTPSSSVGTLYSSSFSMAVSGVVKAIAYKAGLLDSPVTSASFVINTTPPPTGACNWYTSPDVRLGTGDGSIANPWHLQTALDKTGVILAGQTLCLRGGTYQGKFVGRLTGTPSAPITVRSRPGEWARIDISVQAKLVTDIGSGSGNSTILVTDTAGLRPNSFIRIDTEGIWLQSVDYTTKTLTVCRGYGSQNCVGVPHAAGSRVLYMSNITPNGNITAGLGIVGANTIYRDLEVFASNMTRTTNTINTQDDPDSVGSATAIMSDAVGNKIVNMVMHDAAGGSGGPGSLGAEVYGSIISNIGWIDPNRGSGHGFYIHNPTPDLFRVVDNIVFNNFGFGVHGFAQNVQGFANNIWMEGNISFNNGSPGNYPGNVANQSINFRFPDLWVGADPNQPKNITYKNNFTYQPPGASGGGASYGYGPTLGDNVKFEGNYFVGGLGVGPTRTANVTGNTLLMFSPGAGQLLDIRIPLGSVYTWNSNSYFAVNPPVSGCFGGNKAVPFYTNIGASPCAATTTGGGFMTFAEWKIATGFDLNSTYSIGLPGTNAIFIRKNIYEQGRAHIVVYNWQNSTTETISAARVASEVGLVAGQQYQIRNVQNFLGVPVASGIYSGGVLTLPLNNLIVTAPINNPGGFAPASTCPQFCVFVVLPITANSSLP